MTPNIHATATPGSRQQSVERPGCVVHFWLEGPTDGPLVTLTHAALTDHTFFAEMVPALSARFRVLTWDVRGHGASRPLKDRFAIPDAVDDLVAILDELGVERAAVVGQSMGSYVGQELTFRHAGRVSALVVIGGTCITADPGWLGRQLLAVATPTLRIWPFGHLKRASVDAAAENESSRAYLRKRFDELTRSEYLRIMEGVTRCVHPEKSYRTPRPTLLLVGEHDRTGDIRKSMAAWAEREPESEYHVIPDAGHCANLDRPDETTALVVDFLERHLMSSTTAARDAIEGVQP